MDITQEKSLLDELNEVKENYEYLLELTQTTVYTQDTNLVYISMANMDKNLQSTMLIGKTDKDFYSKEDAKKLETIKRKVLKTKNPYRDIVTLTIGEIQRYFDLTVRPVLIDSKVTGLACTSTDITDITQNEKKLEN